MGCASSKHLSKNSSQTQIQEPENLRKYPHKDGTLRLVTYNKAKPVKSNRFINEKFQPLASFAPEQDLSEILSKYNEAMSHFDNHDIDRAYSCADKLKSQHSEALSRVDPACKSRERRNIERIIREYKEVESYNDEINRDGWVLKSDHDGVRISTRKEVDTVGVKMESIVDVPFEVFLSAITEIDFFKKYMPFVETSEQIGIIERNCRIGFTNTKLPFLSSRQSYFQGLGYNRLDKDKCLFLFSRSITNRPDLIEELNYDPSPDPDAIQLSYKYYVVKYEPLGRHRGKVSLTVNADMKLSFMPLFLVDYGSQIFGNQIFANIMKISKEYKGSEWEKKVNKNPAFYDFVDRCIETYLDQMENDNENSKEKTNQKDS